MAPSRTPQGGLAATVAAALVHGDTDATAQEVAEVRASVARSVSAMPDLLRLGVGGVSLVAGVVLSVLERGGMAAAPLERQAELAGRLSALPIPGMAEFVRLTRGLGVVSLYESRSVPASADTARA
jgi:hypothetical protein